MAVRGSAAWASRCRTACPGCGDVAAAAGAGRRKQHRSRPGDEPPGQGLELFDRIGHVVAHDFGARRSLIYRCHHSVQRPWPHANFASSGIKACNRIFDHELLIRRKRRALAAAVPGAAFLLDRAVEDLGERLGDRRTALRQGGRPVLPHRRGGRRHAAERQGDNRSCASKPTRPSSAAKPGLVGSFDQIPLEA